MVINRKARARCGSSYRHAFKCEPREEPTTLVCLCELDPVLLESEAAGIDRGLFSHHGTPAFHSHSREVVIDDLDIRAALVPFVAMLEIAARVKQSNDVSVIPFLLKRSSPCCPTVRLGDLWDEAHVAGCRVACSGMGCRRCRCVLHSHPSASIA